MIKKILVGIKKMLTGEAIDEECQRYVDSHNPKTTADVDRLQTQFWATKAMLNGHFYDYPKGNRK